MERIFSGKKLKISNIVVIFLLDIRFLKFCSYRIKFMYFNYLFVLFVSYFLLCLLREQILIFKVKQNILFYLSLTYVNVPINTGFFHHSTVRSYKYTAAPQSIHSPNKSIVYY